MTDVDLTGQVERLVFVNPENGYCVARFLPDGSSKVEVIVGVMPTVSDGEMMRIKGRRVVDTRFGDQIRVEYVEPFIPTSLEGTERYLASGAIAGVGPVTAQAMVQHFGQELPDVLEKEPKRLREVPGIGKKRAAAIARAWQEKVSSRRLLVGLYGLGLGPGLSGKLISQYGTGAVGIVKENPYRLASEVRGVGFLTADRLAHTLGIPNDSPFRIEAGILYFLDNQAGEGHCFYPADRLVGEAAEMLQLEVLDVEPVLKQLVASGRLRLETGHEQEEIYLPRLFNAEMDCAQSLRRLLARPVSLDNGSLLRAIEWGIRCTRMDLTMEQVEAVRTALLSSCSIITGGPGTGKTTVIRALIGALRHLNEEVQLCAPTGRAAKRMTEATGMEARTIHRLLEFRPETSSFGRNRHYPVAATTVIVDEVSMIDVELMASLLEALSTGTRLVLVGDKDQLESVGPGAVLRDLIDSESLPCTRFSKIHRQAEASLIVVNSHRILNGQWLRSEAGAGRPADFFFMERPDPQQCLETVKELLTTRIPRKFGFDPIRDVQLITPMYKGTIGAQNLNAELQAALNPSGKEVRKGERAFRIGDRVMQLRNNYDKEVFNGDVGFVEGAGDQGLRVRMSDGRSVAYEDSELDELTLAYAVTVHKAQGSEYPAVVMAVHTQHFVMLRRNLLYTGITRGKKLVVLVGTERAARMAIRNDRTRTRFTQLAARLRKMRE